MRKLPLFGEKPREWSEAQRLAGKKKLTQKLMNKNILNTVPVDRQKTNTFDLSHDLKFSFNMGKLIPTTVIDVIPGDSFRIGFENMLRFSALIAPVMHKIKVSTHYFFVPNRIIWFDWERWITGELEVEPPYFIPTDVDPTSDPPETTKYGVVRGSLCDYMGIPPYFNATVSQTNFKINALPFAAYWKIYKEYYMDQNNDPDFDEFFYGDMSQGNNSLQGGSTSYYTEFAYDNSTKVADRAWMHDYFTSALPWAQKGEDVFIPLSNMPVGPVDLQEGYPLATIGVGKLDVFGASDPGTLSTNGNVRVGTQNVWISGQYANNYSLEDDAITQDGTINNLRRAFALQSWLEKNARGGTRYTESILVHFGVRSSDSRLQRPEYLGGSVQNMVISEVLSTAQTLDSSDAVVNPVGQMSGHGVSVGGSRVLNYYAEEHGWIIGLISVMPDTAYQDGIPKKFSKFDKFEYFWPSFQHIGEQAILNQELLAAPLAEPEVNQDTFGYVPRYTEYKYENSRVAGDFRDTLDFWHLGRKFTFDAGGSPSQVPLLNSNFIYPARYDSELEDDPFDRIFAVDSSVADTIYAHVLNIIKARRPMAQYGIPSI